MEAAKTIVIILDIISAILLTVIVMFQSGKSAGLSSAIAGSSGSYMAKGGSKTLDAKLARLTKWVGLAFVVLSLLAVILVSASASAPKDKKSAAADTTPTTTAAIVESGSEPATETGSEPATETGSQAATETGTEPASEAGSETAGTTEAPTEG